MNDTEVDIFALRHSLPVTVLLCLAYSAVFLVGVTGNCLVVTVVYRSPRMRSPTNLFIANLACADLLVNVICLPFTLISNVMEAWTMGWLLCKIIPYLQGVSVNASINTLMAITVERCLAICYPLRWQMTSRACRTACFFIWLVSLTITLPWAVFFKLQTLYEGSDFEVATVASVIPYLALAIQFSDSRATIHQILANIGLEKRSAVTLADFTKNVNPFENPKQIRTVNKTCLESWPTPYSENVYFVVANLLMCYLLPLCFISVCYLLIWRRVCCRTLPGEQHGNGKQLIHRSKIKVIKMLFVVIMLFACSWLPLYAIFTRIKLGGPISPGVDEWVVYNLLPFAQWLGAANSCINPILYAFFNRKFRAGFWAILHSGSCCSPLYYDACSDIRTLSSKDSLMFRSTKVVRDPIKRSRNRMTISAGPSFVVNPLKCKLDFKNNSRALSLRTPSSSLKRASLSADNIRQEDNEGMKNRHGTFV